MIPHVKLKSHDFSDAERQALSALDKVTGPLFAKATQLFIEGAKAAGLSRSVSAGACALSLSVNTARILAMGSGMDPHDIDPEEMQRIGHEAQALLARLVSDYVIACRPDSSEMN